MPAIVYSPEHSLSIAVGSTNAPKVKAVRDVARRRWPQASINVCDVASGVSAQPMGAEETLAGARNRAQNALNCAGSDIGVGLEGGVESGPGGLYLVGWVAVVDRAGCWGFGSSGRVMLPPELAQEVRLGVELGPAVDHWLGRLGTRHNVGAIGVFTDGLITRDEAFAHAVTLAFAPFFHPEWFFQQAP